MLQTLGKLIFHFWICCALLFPCEPTMAAEQSLTNLSVQATWGSISFQVEDAQTNGAGNKSGEQVVSLTKESDMVSWNYKPSRWGMYDVEVLYSAERKSGGIQIGVGGRQLSTNYFATGNTLLFTNLLVGRFYLEKAEPFVLEVRQIGRGIDSAGALNLRGVILSPAPEGKPVVQHGLETLTLHASNAITHSVTMRYEPNEKKNCLGYWVNPQDWAEWKFTVRKPGNYELELWQGCGKEQGGSEVEVSCNGQNFSFVVEDTGHFQNFVARQLGKVKFSQSGNYTLEVRPKNKHAAAVMDVRQVVLKPVPVPD